MPDNTCAPCRTLTAKPNNRHDPPHSMLVAVSHGPDVGHMFGGGSETTYRCSACGAELIHSSDSTETGWR